MFCLDFVFEAAAIILWSIENICTTVHFTICIFLWDIFRRERSKVPLIVRQCVEEIERRGMDEVGIYRVSGVATDIQALKAAFDSSEQT